jgi:uncharacterized damage-inducible protein DinB
MVVPMNVLWPENLPPRVEPDGHENERRSLDGWIAYHRATLLMKCEGLTAEQLKLRSAAPSTLTLLGLVRHMTEVERGWFRIHAASEQLEYPYSTNENPEADFLDVETADASSDIALYVDECQRAQAAVVLVDLDTVIHRKERWFDVRWIYLHMIEEYARHNGHADLLRELIDGATGD